MTAKVKTKNISNLKLIVNKKEIREKRTVQSKAKPRRRLTIKQRNKIILDNQEHAQRLAWKFLKGWRVKLRPDDVNSTVGLALAEAAIRFDPSKQVAFQTFFFYHLRGLLLKEITRLVQDGRLFERYNTSGIVEDGSSNTVVNQIWPTGAVEQRTPELLLHKREIATNCWQACMCLDELEKEVIYRHFVDDQPLKVIANDLGYCRCHISRVKSRAMSKLQSVVSKSVVLTEFIASQSAQLKLREYIQESHRFCYTGGRGRRRLAEDKRKAATVESKLKLVVNGSTK